MIAWDLVAIIGSIFLAGAYSGFETGNYLLNRVRLRFRVAEQDRRARLLDWALRDAQLFICTTLVGHNLAVYIASVTTISLYQHAGLQGRSAEIIATLTLALPFFLFSEVGPKNLFRTRANTLMYAVADLLRLSIVLFYPVTIPLRLLTRLVAGRRGTSADALAGLSRQRLRLFFDEGTTEGVLTTHQNEMVANVMSMRSTPVTAAMTPIAQAVCAPENATVSDFIQLAQGRQISRLAVYRVDRLHVVGLVHIFDVMDPSIQPDDPLKPHVRPVPQIPSSSTVQAALYQLQRRKEPMAVVTDPRGRTVGLLSLEDLAQHIVNPHPTPAWRKHHPRTSGN